MGKVDSLQLVANFKTRLKVAFKHLKRLYISIRLMFRNKQSKSSQMSFYDESERQFAWKRWKIITVLLSFHSNVSLIMPFGLIRKFSTYLVRIFYLHRHSNSRPATEALYCTITPAGGGLWVYSVDSTLAWLVKASNSSLVSCLTPPGTMNRCLLALVISLMSWYPSA